MTTADHEGQVTPGRGRLLALASLLAVLVGTLATASGETAACGQPVERRAEGTWTTAAVPAFDPPDTELVQYAVDPRDPSTVFVTGGRTVARTTDAGCAWKKVYELPPGAFPTKPFGSQTHQIVGLSVSSIGRVFIVVRETAASSGNGIDPRPHIVASDDGGASWRVLDTSNVLGWALGVSASPANPRVLFLTVTTSPDTIYAGEGTALYASEDGGAHWTLRSMLPRDPTGDTLGINQMQLARSCPAPGACFGVPFWKVVPDPGSADEVWVATQGFEVTAIYHSTDQARNWTPVFSVQTQGTGAVTALDVSGAPGRTSRLAAFAELFRRNPEGMYWSDGGTRWQVRHPPSGDDPVRWVATGRKPDELVAITDDLYGGDGRVAYRYDGASWMRLNPPTLPGTGQLHGVASSAAGNAFTFLASAFDEKLELFLLTYRPAPTLQVHPHEACSELIRRGDWTRIPTLSGIEAQNFGGYGVDASLPDRLYSTDGRRVFRTHDGGCTWELAFSLGLAPLGTTSFDPASSTIRGLAIPPDPRHGRALLAISEDPQQAEQSRPHVLATTDDGATWHAADVGLPVSGDPVRIIAAPSDPDVIYLVLALQEPTTIAGSLEFAGAANKATLLYATEDGGLTWQLRSGSATARAVLAGVEVTPGSLRALAVDPVNPRELWAVSASGSLYRSTDGGRSWRDVLTPAMIEGLDLWSVAVFRKPGAPPSVLAVDPTSGFVYLADDANAGPWNAHPETFFETAFPYLVSATWGQDENTALVGNGKGVFRMYRPGGPGTPVQWVDVSPDRIVIELSADGTSSPFFFGREYGESAILRYILGPLPDAPSRFANRFDFPDLPPLKRDPVSLEPGLQNVQLDPGTSTTIPYTLTLPRRPVVDIFLLIDTTSSMRGTILSLQRGLARLINQVRGQGIDAWFGIGEFRTYRCPGTSVLGSGPEYEAFPYRRDRAVGPADRELADALGRLEGSYSGSGAALTGLYQAASGRGQNDVIPPGEPANNIPSGHDARFRPNSIRLIINASDRYFMGDGRGDVDSEWCPGVPWPGPSFAEAIAALKAARVHQVGLYVDTSPIISSWNGHTALDDLKRVAKETNTLAAEPVDCNGDGTIDLKAGDPLVCGVVGELSEGSGDRLADAVTALVRSIADPASVRVSELVPSGVVAAITPPALSNVNLNANNRLRFDVTFTCPAGVTGTRPVLLGGFAREQLEATAFATVTCGTPARLPIVRSLALPAPPPAEPVPGQAPGPQPGPQSQSQSAPEPHAAVAPNRQPQAQTALVQVTQAIQEQEGQLAFSQRGQRGRPGEAGWPLTAGITALAAAYGWVALARARAQVRRVRR